jgi:very-long-chain (3R)-3-hydroxyacyl-CoA dehydratase
LTRLHHFDASIAHMVKLTAIKVYLIGYNLALGVGWGLVALRATLAWLAGGPLDGFEAASSLAQLLQLVSLLESVHAATGFVRSGVAANLTQWLGRSHALFAVAVPFKQVLSGTVFLPLMLIVWGIGEVIRYPWYADVRTCMLC